MSTDNELFQKKRELKQTINHGMRRAFPAYFYNLIGNGFVKIFGLKKRPHWGISAFVLYVLLLLPGPLIAWATGEIHQWGKFELALYGNALFVYFGSVVSYVNLEYNILPGIRDHIIDEIQSVESLAKLGKWLSPMWSVSNWSAFVIGVGFLYVLSTTFFQTRVAGNFVGIGILVSNILFGAAISIPPYIILKMLTLPGELSNYQLRVYESDPASSEVLQRLIHFLNIYIYIVVGYCAIGTMIGALTPGLSWVIWLYISLGWMPTIIQFLVNQYAIRKIIIGAKWQSLNQLQEQIRELQSGNLKKAPEKTISRINQLMDLHDRISSKPNSILNWGTGLSFLNQLMLPLLGLLLGNIDKLLKLLTP